MNLRTLDSHDVLVICHCINAYGSEAGQGLGVEATSHNLQYFQADFAKRCLGKAITNNFIRTDVKVLLRTIRDRVTE